MEVFQGRPLQSMQLHQPLNLNPSHSVKKSFITVSSDYSLKCTTSSLSATAGIQVPFSVQRSLGGTVLKKARLMNDSLIRTSELKLSNKFLENLSILKGFKTKDTLEKTKTKKSTHTGDQGGLRTKPSILKGWHVVLDLDHGKTSFQERLELKNEILSHGGIVGFSVTKKTTHLLVDGIQKRSYSFKRHCAQKYGADVVSVDYVRDCLESGSVLKVERYIAADRVETENKENNPLFGKIKASGKQRGALTEKPVKGTGEDLKLKSIVWEEFEGKADYQIAKLCFMKNMTNEEECVHLELHVLTESVASRFRIYYQLLQEDISLLEMCCSVSSSLQAVSMFCKITKSLQKSYSVTDVKSMIAGSPKFQKMQMETHTMLLSKSVQTLVDIVWKEAIGSASASVDIRSVTTEKVNKATVTLAQIKETLGDKGATKKQLQEKSKQFYSQICYQGTSDVIDTKRKINQMQELCTLLHDVMNVQEALDWKKNMNTGNKYRSLRCKIQSVDTDSSQFKTVMCTLGKEALESSRIQVIDVYSLTRPLEDCIFAPKGRKVTSLVHATRPTSLLGILSRGLLPPKIVQEDVGIERRDFGFLGQGIYFGDDIRSNIHFTEPNGCTKTRFLLVCDVIVGKQFETWQHRPDFVCPPPGYDSVLGVKNYGENHSMFKHNEYTIYDVGQQRLSYLIEFVQVNETPMIYQPEFINEGTEEPSDEGESNEIDISDVMDVSDPLDKVTPGLQTSGGQPVLLERVSVRAKMMDLVAQVTVFQRYRNTNTRPIEAKYVFPLDDTAAVCGFEAFIGDKHIVGEVKEKETAHKEYKEAVSKGHGAYLMDEESADVFTVSVGNLPPSTEVIIKIIYIVELSLDDDQIVFHLPGSLASWRKEGALAEETQNVTSTVATGDNEKIKFEMSLSMEMPFDIQTIKCSTHDIKIKRTAAKACITLAEGEDCLKEGFHLSVKLHKIHQPHMWVEQNPNDKDSQACMLTFYPEFEFPQLKKPDVTVILDCSNSMKGESFEHAKKVCYMIASLMPKTYTVNIIKFGTTFKELYPSSRLSAKIDFDELKDFLAKASPAEGNTDVWRPLHSHYLLEGEDLRNVFVISDGHVSNETETLKSIAKNSSHTRIFTFGVSTTCNRHMLKIMARSGAGAFEFFDGKTKSSWQRKVKNQLQRAGQPSVNSLSVSWHQFDSYAPKPRQAPRHLGALFSGSRLVVFGFVPYCTSATLTAIIDGQEISTIVSTSDLCITKGLTLHRLTARALIRDWEDGMLDVDRIEEEIAKEKEKQAIISLSRQHSIVTSLTSFVAIEERDKHEVQKKLNMEEKLQELLRWEDVDVLPYMDWQLKQEVTLDLDVKDKLEAMQQAQARSSMVMLQSCKSYLSMVWTCGNQQENELEEDEDDWFDDVSSSSDESSEVYSMLPTTRYYGALLTLESDSCALQDEDYSTSSDGEESEDSTSSESEDSSVLALRGSYGSEKLRDVMYCADIEEEHAEEGFGVRDVMYCADIEEEHAEEGFGVLPDLLAADDDFEEVLKFDTDLDELESFYKEERLYMAAAREPEVINDGGFIRHGLSQPAPQASSPQYATPAATTTAGTRTGTSTSSTMSPTYTPTSAQTPASAPAVVHAAAATATFLQRSNLESVLGNMNIPADQAPKTREMVSNVHSLDEDKGTAWSSTSLVAATKTKAKTKSRSLGFSLLTDGAPRLAKQEDISSYKVSEPVVEQDKSVLAAKPLLSSSKEIPSQEISLSAASGMPFSARSRLERDGKQKPQVSGILRLIKEVPKMKKNTRRKKLIIDEGAGQSAEIETAVTDTEKQMSVDDIRVRSALIRSARRKKLISEEDMPLGLGAGQSAEIETAVTDTEKQMSVDDIRVRSALIRSARRKKLISEEDMPLGLGAGQSAEIETAVTDTEKQMSVDDIRVRSALIRSARRKKLISEEDMPLGLGAGQSAEIETAVTDTEKQMSVDDIILGSALIPSQEISLSLASGTTFSARSKLERDRKQTSQVSDVLMRRGRTSKVTFDSVSIESTLERGDKLGDLVEKADALSRQSKAFYKPSVRSEGSLFGQSFGSSPASAPPGHLQQPPPPGGFSIRRFREASAPSEHSGFGSAQFTSTPGGDSLFGQSLGSFSASAQQLQQQLQQPPPQPLLGRLQKPTPTSFAVLPTPSDSVGLFGSGRTVEEQSSRPTPPVPASSTGLTFGSFAAGPSPPSGHVALFGSRHTAEEQSSRPTPPVPASGTGFTFGSFAGPSPPSGGVALFGSGHTVSTGGGALFGQSYGFSSASAQQQQQQQQQPPPQPLMRRLQKPTPERLYSSSSFAGPPTPSDGVALFEPGYVRSRGDLPPPPRGGGPPPPPPEGGPPPPPPPPSGSAPPAHGIQKQSAKSMESAGLPPPPYPPPLPRPPPPVQRLPPSQGQRKMESAGLPPPPTRLDQLRSSLTRGQRKNVRHLGGPPPPPPAWAGGGPPPPPPPPLGSAPPAHGKQRQSAKSEIQAQAIVLEAMEEGWSMKKRGRCKKKVVVRDRQQSFEEERLGDRIIGKMLDQRREADEEKKKVLPERVPPMTTDETFTDEPGVDSKFELFKVPQLRKVTNQPEFELANAAVKLCQKMHGQSFAKHEEVLEFLGIPEKTFLNFFRHVGIYSLGQVAADAFLMFFTTWLVYVFIKVLARKAFPKEKIIHSTETTDSLAQMESWLNQQGSFYNVKDYYLGHSSWNEVAMQMLGVGGLYLN